MRRAVAIVCIAVSAGCTSQTGTSSGSTSPGTSPGRAAASSSSPQPTPRSTARSTAVRTDATSTPRPDDPAGADDQTVVPAIADDPATIGRQLVAAERTVRARGASPSRLLAAARTAQAAYRRLGLHPEWDATASAVTPASLRPTVSANIRARRELHAITDAAPRHLLPAWRIQAPAAARDLLAWYRAAGAQFGVGWQYLAAINLVETTFGKVHGLSSAGAQGPMQFIPETWANYGAGGDVDDPHDAIFGAARYLADRGMARGDVDGALYAYNPTVHYANAVKAIASVLVADPGSFAGYYRWDVYYPTSSGVLLLPRGFSEDRPTSAAAYARAHPERVLR